MMGTAAKLYEQDFYAWAQHQAQVVRQGIWHEIDQEHLAKELEALSRRERQAVRSRLVVLVAHLLKWHYQPAWRTPSWRYTIREQRLAITDLLTESLSLRPEASKLLAMAYPRARLRAARETRLPDATFPETCPWTGDQVLDADFWPTD
jgi:hypothetical protein